MENLMSIEKENIDYPYPINIIKYYDQLSKWNIKPQNHQCFGINYCKICFDFYINIERLKPKHPCTTDTSCLSCFKFYCKHIK